GERGGRGAGGRPDRGHRMTRIAIRSAVPADYPVIAQLTVAAYRHDWQVTPGHPYERVLANVADRATAGELLVAEDQQTGRILGSVLFVLPGSRYAELAGPGEGSSGPWRWIRRRSAEG